MKYSVLSALIGATTAHADAPAYYNEPPFSVATHPAAAGLVQVESACAMFGVDGVTCAPANNELFATGMNGDEDLGEDITMKGDKFHFVEKPAEYVQFATGMNGDEDLGEDITMKGDKFHFVQNPLSAHALAQAEPAAKGEAKGTGVVYDIKGYSEPDKVHTLDPKIAKAHTTFYNKQ